MDWIKLLESVLSGHSITNWTCSVNGHRKGPVIDGKVGLKNVSTFWAHMKFEIDGVVHHIDGERPLTGGASTIAVDGHMVPSSHLALRTHIAGFPPSMKIEIDFDCPGKVYRFDGKVS
ncbi:MAG TPA: hypothetical protein VEP90_28110 [Methylomirabilota bacterium]|nr:hypothetical protein [Methylomirabilota bacterium]